MLIGNSFTDEEENSEDVQMGEVGSEQPNQIDRNMWAGEDQDNKEVHIISTQIL